MSAGSFERILERTSSAASQADWRLLPGVPEAGRALVLASRGDRVAEALAIVFEEVVAVNEELVQEPMEATSSVRPPGTVEIIDGRRGLPALSEGTFDLVACPHGLPRSLLSGPLHESLRRLRSLLRPGGALVVGVSSRARAFTRVARSRPRGGPSLRRRLRRAGFDTVDAHLALPSHLAPTLFAPMTGPAASFALELHAAGRLPSALRRALLHPLVAPAIAWLLADRILVGRMAPVARTGAEPC